MTNDLNCKTTLRYVTLCYPLSQKYLNTLTWYLITRYTPTLLINNRKQMLSLFWLDIIFLRPSHYAISTYLIIMLRPIITNVASWQSIPIFHSKQMYYPAMENHKCQSLSEILKFFTICEQFDLLVALAGEKAGDPQTHYDSSSRYRYRILSMVKMF